MGRRHGDQDALLADGHDAEAVHHGDALEAVLGFEGGGDLHHGAQGQGVVGGVGELLDGEVVEGVAGCSCGVVLAGAGDVRGWEADRRIRRWRRLGESGRGR